MNKRPSQIQLWAINRNHGDIAGLQGSLGGVQARVFKQATATGLGKLKEKKYFYI